MGRVLVAIAQIEAISVFYLARPTSRRRVIVNAVGFVIPYGRPILNVEPKLAVFGAQVKDTRGVFTSAPKADIVYHLAMIGTQLAVILNELIDFLLIHY